MNAVDNGLAKMSKEYPTDYTGPKAGQSTDEEWLAVREYQAYKWLMDGTWTYSDFDCYLASLTTHAFKFGFEMKEEDKQKFYEKYYTN